MNDHLFDDEPAPPTYGVPNPLGYESLAGGPSRCPLCGVEGLTAWQLTAYHHVTAQPDGTLLCRAQQATIDGLLVYLGHADRLHLDTAAIVDRHHRRTS